MRAKIALVVTGVLAVAVAASQLTGQPPAKTADPDAAETDNAADRATIRAAGQSFIKAYLAGDAKALAAHWTRNGEYFSDDGTTIRGRASLEKAYAERFGTRKARTAAEFDPTSIRFPSGDTAIEEGYFKVRTGKDMPISTRYTMLHVREGGKWLLAVVREWPGEGASLRDLDWLIGTWVAKRDDTDVHTTYEWWAEKKFIRASITLKQDGRTVTGFQMIGKDGATGQVRSWLFDSDGGFGEATWTRDGKKWTQESAGVLENGSVLSSSNIMTRIDGDTFTFQSVERTVGGEEADDIPPVRVTRVKGK